MPALLSNSKRTPLVRWKSSELSGRIGNAELAFGTFTVLLSDEYPEYGIRAPQASGGLGASIHLHVDDVDAMTA